MEEQVQLSRHSSCSVIVRRTAAGPVNYAMPSIYTEQPWKIAAYRCAFAQEMAIFAKYRAASFDIMMVKFTITGNLPNCIAKHTVLKFVK